jgi:hypothetical protein
MIPKGIDFSIELPKAQSLKAKGGGNQDMKYRVRHGRRRFISNLAQGCVAASMFWSEECIFSQSRPAKPANLVSLTKPVLGPSDFQYLGAFHTYADGLEAAFQGGLTHRYVQNSLRLYTISSVNTGFHLYEMAAPAIKTSSFDSATLTADYGNICSGKMAVDNPNPTLRIYGIYWDEPDQRMYWIYQDIYNVVYPNSACVGYSILNDTTKVGTGIKAVRLPQSIGCKVAHGITPIPDMYARYVTNGWRLGLGFGGDESAHASGPASIGPALIAIDSAEIGSVSDQGYLTKAKIMVRHNYNAVDRTSPWRARRDKDYHNNFGDGWNPGSEDYGFWQWTDYLKQSGTWIDTGTKHGFLVMPVLSCLGGTTEPVIQTFAASPAPTTTSATLNGVLPGLAIGDYVQFEVSGYSQGLRVKITGVSGSQINFTDIYGSPLPAPPTVPGQIFRGQFYSGGEPGSVHSKHTWFVYDPVKLSYGALGQTPVDLVQPERSWDVQFPGFTYPLPSWSGGPPGMIVGTTFDSRTNLLYVMLANQPPIIAVYRVAS